MSLTTHVSQFDKTQTPYKIDPDQTLRASQALLKHVQAEVKRIQNVGGKRNLLGPNDSDDGEEEQDDSRPVWLNLATKQYITDKNRLKPSKIHVPHSLNKSENSTICLITTDPQRAIKNAVADATFPPQLSARITRIIGFTKLMARYKSFEQRRQLLSEHDVFLADDRIVSRLPKALGKVFYKGTAKRPIPINLAPRDAAREKSTTPVKKVAKDERQAAVTTPATIAQEIEKALACVPVTLSPGYNVAVRIGLQSFSASQLQDNVMAVTNGIIDKHVAGGWKNVKSVHIKTPTSMALPIWLAEELWNEIDKTTGEEATDGPQIEELEDESRKRKRKAHASRGAQSGDRKKLRLAEEKAKENEESTARKARIAAQKGAAFETV